MISLLLRCGVGVFWCWFVLYMVCLWAGLVYHADMSYPILFNAF